MKTKDASLIGVFAAEAGEPPPAWHVPIPPDDVEAECATCGADCDCAERGMMCDCAVCVATRGD